MHLTSIDGLLRAIDALGHLVPLLVAGASLSRMARSRGVSRWICGNVAAFSLAILGFIFNTGDITSASHQAVLACSWLMLPLWLFVRRTSLRNERLRPVPVDA